MSYRQSRGWFTEVNGLPVIKRPVRNVGGQWASGRPIGYVFHYTVGCNDDISGTLNARGISCHFGVTQGGAIYQYASANKVAYHADNANGFYWGVEHSATQPGGSCPLNDVQLDASAKLTAALVEYTRKLKGFVIPLRMIDGPELIPGFHDHADGDGVLWNFNRHTERLYNHSWASYLELVHSILNPTVFEVRVGETERRFRKLRNAIAYAKEKVLAGLAVRIRKVGS